MYVCVSVTHFEPCDWSTRLSLVIHLYTKHVYTECTDEGWADQQVSDGGPRSLYIQYKCTELKNDESDYDDKSGHLQQYLYTDKHLV